MSKFFSSIKSLFSNSLFLQNLHVVGLSTLAVTQPLFDILSKNPTYFIANHIDSGHIRIIALIIWLLLPIGLVALNLLFHWISETLARRIQIVEIAFLSSILFSSILSRATFIPGFLTVTVSLLLAGGLAYVYAHRSGAKSFLSVIAFSIVVVPATFLLNTSISRLLFEPKTSLILNQQESNIPVVLVIFDEFSAVTIMDANRQIDSLNFPNLKAFSNTSYWFRNASGVSDATDFAVPAILTGQYPTPTTSKLPFFEDYPENIFTLLGSNRDVSALESITRLCPPELVKQDSANPEPTFSLKSTLSDLWLIYLHLNLPNDITARLPSVTRNWGGFTKATSDVDTQPDSVRALALQRDRLETSEALTRDRVWRYYHLINGIKSGPQTPLIVMHNLIPHVPWEYLPNGKKYLTELNEPIPGLSTSDEKWSNDTTQVIQDYQRYTLQASYVDRMIGDLLARLKKIDLFDRSLIIVTADHGVSFVPGDFRRPLSPTNFSEILPVPFFVKLPHQNAGQTSDRNVANVDILPTIAAVLGIKIPWEVDGTSVLDTIELEKRTKIAFNSLSRRLETFQPFTDDSYRAVQRKLSLFGSDVDPYRRFRIGDHPDIIGKSVVDLPIVNGNGLSYWIRNGRYYEDVHLESDILLTNIKGRIETDRPWTERKSLAVSINGVIASVTRTSSLLDGRFVAMVPGFSLNQGFNDVRVYLVEGNNEHLKLVRPQGQIDYSLVAREDGSTVLRDNKGVSRPISTDASGGSIDSVEFKNGQLILTGWSADTQKGRLADWLLLFLDDKLFYLGVPRIQRPDLASFFHNDQLLNCGYYFDFAYALSNKTSIPKVRAFAIFGDEARELSDAKAIVKKRFQSAKGHYVLRGKANDKWVLSPRGTKFRVIPNMVNSGVDVFTSGPSGFHISGWTASVADSVVPDSILIFIKGLNIVNASVGIPRPDISSHFKNRTIQNSGFDVEIPFREFNSRGDTAHIQIFAKITRRGTVSEISRRK